MSVDFSSVLKQISGVVLRPLFGSSPLFKDLCYGVPLMHLKIYDNKWKSNLFVTCDFIVITILSDFPYGYKYEFTSKNIK